MMVGQLSSPDTILKHDMDHILRKLKVFVIEQFGQMQIIDGTQQHVFEEPAQ